MEVTISTPSPPSRRWQPRSGVSGASLSAVSSADSCIHGHDTHITNTHAPHAHTTHTDTHTSTSYTHDISHIPTPYSSRVQHTRSHLALPAANHSGEYGGFAFSSAEAQECEDVGTWHERVTVEDLEGVSDGSDVTSGIRVGKGIGIGRVESSQTIVGGGQVISI